MHRIAAAAFALISLTGTGNASAQPQKSAPPRNSDLRLLRFSPDGHYVLAQDDSGVTVLTVQPFAVLFRAPAENATPAWFTPDSQQVVFVSSATRADSQRIALVGSPVHVERWSIANHARIQSRGIRMDPCDTEGLSPDGRVLACVGFGGTLRLIGVASGEIILEVKQFGRLNEVVEPYTRENQNPKTEVWGDPGAAEIEFSPDGRFVIAAPDGAKADGSPVAFDLRERQRVKLTGETKSATHRVFAFIASDRVLMAQLDLVDPAVRATLVAFPSGKVLLKPKIPAGGFLSRATDPGFVLIHPFGLHA